MLAYRYLGYTLVIYGLGYLLAPIEPNFDLDPSSLWLWLASATASMAGLVAAPWLWRQWASWQHRDRFRCAISLHSTLLFGLRCRAALAINPRRRRGTAAERADHHDH